jgi:AAA domain
LLKELEEPYLARIDPYAESKPIHDPTWFYGRDELLKRSPAMLAQGQHVGIFGLRKVGKTSLINQLRQRFVTTPTVFIDCQAFSARAEIFFEEILKQLQTEFRAHAVKGIPARLSTVDAEGFRQQFLTFYERWEKTGQRGPFLIILDEIDKLFPNQEMHNSEEILSEYVRFFRLLRGLAQSRQCLVTLVIAYRPDVNRRNLLTPAVGENSTFQSFQEDYLGFLNPDDSEAMIREIGRWKQIEWDEDAARRVFDYCGGPPLITRFFASHACEEGVLKAIDYPRVEETAEEIQATLRRHEIGNYYREGIWELLCDDEQQVLRLICERGQAGFPEDQFPRDLEDALTNVERFGLVASHGDSVYLTAHLFHVWLERRISS